MRIRLPSLLAIISCAAFVVGCTDSGDGDASEPTTAAREAPPFAELSVDQVDKLLTSKDAKVAIYDANSQSTREASGIIPAATLLPSSSQYELSLLPADKETKLIFYCGSEQCSASDTAAKRASANGYSDVCVLRAGIKGWKAAGKATKDMT